MTENEQLTEATEAPLTALACETSLVTDASETSEDSTDTREEEVCETDGEETDYEALAKADLIALSEEFPSLRSISSILELDNPERYAQLRDLGLSPREAYLATATRKPEKGIKYDNRSHLHSSVPKSHGGRVDAMSIGELREARDLFSGMSDSEIVRLYKKVNS